MNNDIENKDWVNDYPALKRVAKGNPFTVPGDFFNASEEQILSSVNILAASPAGEVSFGIPAGYFQEMESNILSRVNIEHALGIDNAFTMPAGYLEEMKTQLISRIAVEEAARTPFTIPEGYFDKLNRNILNQTAGLEAIQRKGIIRKLVSSAAFKYASAACFAIIVGVSIFLTQQNSPQATHDKSYLHQALSQIPNADIKGYLEMRVDAKDTNVKMDNSNKSDLNAVSADDVRDYLSNN